MTGPPKHEPVADAKHRLLGHNLKAAAPVETHVPGPVCFQITNALVLVEQLADRRHQLASDSLSLARTIDRRRAQMPVIEPRIMARPDPEPVPDPWQAPQGAPAGQDPQHAQLVPPGWLADRTSTHLHSSHL